MPESMLDNLKTYIPEYSCVDKKVSEWSVGMHLEHCLLAAKGISDAVVKSQSYTGKVKKSALRRIIFLTGMIPRGRGKSPEDALPNDQITEPELQSLLAEADQSTKNATDADGDCYWEHFAFGIMKRDDALKFIEIHNNHHLKIIRDILTGK